MPWPVEFGLTILVWDFKNLTVYYHFSWVFGDFLCKMYQFVHSLSYTASIFILVVICTERYFAIIHPITCKQILTSTRLRVSKIILLFRDKFATIDLRQILLFLTK